MRVLIFSHIRLFGEALVSCLTKFDDYEDVWVCQSVEHLSKEVRKLRPDLDLVLIDVANKQALREARAVCDACPGIVVMALALIENSKNVIECADAGFMGYVPRQASVNELRQLMKMAIKGECSCHPSIATSLLREVNRRKSVPQGTPPREKLTKRECEILTLVGSGLSNKAIATQLSLCVSTVKNHTHKIFTKLHLKCRAQAVAQLRREPWLTEFGGEMSQTKEA